MLITNIRLVRFEFTFRYSGAKMPRDLSHSFLEVIQLKEMTFQDCIETDLRGDILSSLHKLQLFPKKLFLEIASTQITQITAVSKKIIFGKNNFFGLMLQKINFCNSPKNSYKHEFRRKFSSRFVIYFTLEQYFVLGACF